MKKIEKANIITVHNNMLKKDLPIFSIVLEYQNDSGVQGTGGYTGDAAVNFIKNLIKILEVKDKRELKGQTISAYTEFNQLLAIGNESESKWIDLKNIDKIIEENIIEYFEEKDKNIDNEFEK